MDLASFALNKRVISALSTILILAAGLYAYTALPKFEDPEFIIRQAQIITPYPGASAEEVADEVTDTIEAALQQLSGVEEITSNSQPGRSTVTVEFTIPAAKTRSDLAQKFTEMRAKISDVQGQLPPGSLGSLIFDDFGDVYAQYYAITGEGFSLPELYAYAKDLERELVLVDGVSKVALTGVQDEVIYVEFSTARLIQLGLSTDQISSVLKGQNLVTPGGSIKAGDIRLRVRATSAVNSVQAIENLVIVDPKNGKSYRLGDISNVTRGLKDPATQLLYRNGKPAIAMGISNVIGGNVVILGAALDQRMQELMDQRPIGIDVEPISDQGASVRISVNDFVMNVVLALVIVVGTLLIFMGLRSGILMGGILLVTVAGTLFGMLLYGLDMQRISLGALIIALGMLVDNAIVVVEGTLVRVQKGESAASASVAIVNQTKWPLLGGTVVGFLAFSPIGFSPDNTGEYAGSLFWTVMIALLFSWLVAVWLTPWFCVLLLKPGKVAEKPENVLMRGYRTFLGRAIHYRYVTVGIVVALFFSALAVQPFVPPGFFPASTRPQFVIDYFLPDGTDIEATQADILKISEYARTLGGVTSTNTSVGKGHLRFMLSYTSEDANPAYGQILVDVEEYKQIDALVVDLQAWVGENLPQANSKVWKFMLGPGGGSNIEARFFGPDPVVLRQLASEAKAIMEENGAIAIKDDWREQVPVLRPQIDTENARRLGLTQGDISAAIAGQLDGTRIGIYREDDELRNIIMRPIEADRKDVGNLKDIYVFSNLTGGYIPIAQVVQKFDLVFEAGNLRRIDRKLMITAQSDNAPGVLSGDLFEQVRGPIEAIDLPPGYTLEWKGEYGNSQEANEGLAMTMPIGFGAMIIVVILLFNAVRQPLIIWLTVPLSLIGVIWGLALSGTPMEFMAILGVLSLTGMLIKNAIVLIDETDNQIGGGKARMSAIIDSGVSRVRPVSLGVLTTVLGVVPLLSDPFFKSLAVVIICGLSFATILTLIVVPVLYSIFYRVTEDEITPEAT
ncbi:MAG: multidrug transporter AcrB [Rhodobacteraceae bacterium]|nr:MAG: multidrug transporter AcrB [Paracoccaceae bacterium]